MKEKQGDEKDNITTIEEQNKKLKLAGRVFLVLILILIIVLAFNMVEVRKLKEITKGDYITVEDCQRKYELNELFEGIEVTLNGSRTGKSE